MVKHREDIGVLSDGPSLSDVEPSVDAQSDASARREAVRRSATAKDCSIMIGLHRSDDDGEQDGQGVDPPHAPIREKVDLDASSKRVIVRGYRGYSYSASVVDLDHGSLVQKWSTTLS